MKKATYLFNKAIVFLTFVLTGIAFIGSLYTFNSFSHYMRDTSGYYKATATTGICIFLGCIVLVGIFRFTFGLLERLSEKKLKVVSIILFVIFAVVSIFIVINFQSIPSADSVAVEGEALAIAKGRLSVIDADINDYFGRYYNNDFLTLLTALFFKICLSMGISNTVLATISLNALAVFLSQIFAYLAVRKLSGVKTACKYMALSTLQPILYLSIPWYYSLTICLPFMTSSLYFCICAYKAESNKKRILYGILFALVTVTGYYIRPVVMITAIACAICACMVFIIKKGMFKRFAAASLCCVIVFTGSFLAIKGVLSHYRKDTDDNDIFPMAHWLMMGVSEHGTLDYGDQDYIAAFKTKQEKTEASIREIKKRLSEKGVLGTLKLLYGKQVINWSEGAAGYPNRLIMNNKYGSIYKYIAGDRLDFMLLYCQAYRAAVLLLAAIYLFKLLFKKNIGLIFMPVLTLFGGMLFYLIWEAKRCYSVPFIFLLLMLSSYMLNDLSEKYKRILPNNRKKIFAAKLCIIAAVLGMFWSKSEKYTVDEVSSKTHSVNTRYTRILEPYEDFGTIKQSFYTENPFDRINFSVKKSDDIQDGLYQMTVKDSGGNILVKKKFSESKIKTSGTNQTITLKFDRIIPDGRQKYTVTVKSLNDNKTIVFYRENGIEADMYEGKFECDGEKHTNDLIMNVYSITEEPYMPVIVYVFIILLTTVPYLSLAVIEQIMIIKKKERKNEESSIRI